MKFHSLKIIHGVEDYRFQTVVFDGPDDRMAPLFEKLKASGRYDYMEDPYTGFPSRIKHMFMLNEPTAFIGYVFETEDPTMEEFFRSELCRQILAEKGMM